MRKGQIMSVEQRKKISKAHKGKRLSEQHRLNLSLSHLGKRPSNLESLRFYRKDKPLSDEHKERIRQSNLGKKHTWTLEGKQRFSDSRKGKSSWNKGLKGYNSGEANPRYIKDRTKLKKFHKRQGVPYVEWREKCKNRDDRKCRIGNKDCMGQLEVHHILTYIIYPELRYEINNGITLCHFHHPRKKKDVENLIGKFKELLA